MKLKLEKRWYSHDEVIRMLYPDPKKRKAFLARVKVLQKRNREEYRAEVARKLQRAREKRKMTQQALAKNLKTTRSAISRIEHGKQNLSIDYLFRYSQALDRRIEINVLNSPCNGKKNVSTEKIGPRKKNGL